MKRRDFVYQAMLAGITLSLPLSASCFASGKRRKVRLGICTDVHQDIMHDGEERLKKFITEAKKRDLDFIIQLGDFCRPYDKNKDFLSIWDNYPGEKFHVLGNHDMDGGFSREQVLKFWGVSDKYYSFDKNGFHFVVLDGNDKNPSPNRSSGYARYIGEEQLNWLKKDIKNTNLPCIIYSHQTLENNNDGIENRQQIRELFETENLKGTTKKVIACFSGHHHTDYATKINGIYYIQINSMSNEWLGGDFKNIRYSKEVDEKHPWIKYTVPYKDPLFAFIEIDDSNIRIEGRKSEFVGPSPEELKYPRRPENKKITPKISDRKLKR